MTIFTDNSKVNENLLAENDILKQRIKMLEEYVANLKYVISMKNEVIELQKAIK
jgi:hypothetical protein